MGHLKINDLYPKSNFLLARDGRGYFEHRVKLINLGVHIHILIINMFCVTRFLCSLIDLNLI